MATYYVRKTGNDGSAGTSPATAWLTLGKALGAAGMASGDTCYVGPGKYAEVVTLALTNPTGLTRVIADPFGAQTGDAPGEVIWSAYTSGDTSAPSGSACLSMASRDYMSFEGFKFIGGSHATQNCVVMPSVSGTSEHCRFLDCQFWSGGSGANPMVDIHVNHPDNSDTLLDRCVFVGVPGFSAANVRANLVASGSGADYDCGITLQNCLSLGSFVRVHIDGSANTFNGGGVDVLACTVIGGTALNVATGMSTTVPCTITNCYIYAGSNTGLIAATSGQITEADNVICAGTARSNVSAGTGSISNGSIAPMLELAPPTGFPMRYPFEPASGSPLLTHGTTGNPSTDGRSIPRPAGAASVAGGIGWLERANTFARVAANARTGTHCLEITGPGVQDFQVPVSAQATTVSLYVFWDATYAGTKPSMSVLNGGACGVSDATATATGSASTWERISLSFTPTATGVVTIRATSSDTNGAGVMRVDDAGVTRSDVRGFAHIRANQPVPALFDASAIVAIRSAVGRSRSRL